jgi:hypothetical protein
MPKYFVKHTNGTLKQHNTNKKTRRNIKNNQFSKPRVLKENTRNKIEGLKIKLQENKPKTKMLAHLKTFNMAKQTQQADIKIAIDGYHKIIKTLQDKIQTNNKKMEEFNKMIVQNIKQLESLKGNEEIISSFKTKMEEMETLHNEVIIKDNEKCHTLISDTQENINKLEKILDEVSKMGFKTM